MYNSHWLIFHRILYALKESEGKWTNRRLCLGSKDTCHSGLIGREKSLLILSFAEDDDGKTSLQWFYFTRSPLLVQDGNV